MSASTTIRQFRPGERVRHADLGEGVVIAAPVDGFIKVFFPTGERQVPVAGLASALSRSEVIVLNARGDAKRALGKVDDRGQIAEDLRTQILGQLSMQLNYASLYADALSDPMLKRTRVELETAMSNAVEARKVVFELFQDLDGFRLDDYKAMGNPEEGMGALARFLADVARAEGETFTSRSDKLFAWFNKDTQTEALLTTERELSLQEENVQLLGLDHPLISGYLRKHRGMREVEQERLVL